MFVSFLMFASLVQPFNTLSYLSHFFPFLGLGIPVPLLDFRYHKSPAIFQSMINEISKDIINEGKITAFINDILIRTKTKKGYNEIMEKVLKRLEKNNLYVKPEKYAWKMQKVNFLKVVIGQGKIKIKKDKVVGVLNWPIPKIVKDIRKFLGLINYYR